MAVFLSAKAPGAIYRYTWAPDVQDGDGLASYTVAVTTGTVAIDSSEQVDNSVVLFLSGGAAGETAILAVTGESNEGESYVDTLYLPIQASTNAFAYTARDVVGFALRKIAGNGNAADSVELDDALERLNDMLAAWKDEGADAGVALPLTASSVIYASDSFVSGIKHSLRVACHEHYGQPVDPGDVMAARKGLQKIKNANLPETRAIADFY